MTNIKSNTSLLWCYIWDIQRCLASVAFLALQFVCFAYVMHTCRPVFLWWPLWDRDQQASDPLTEKLFSFFGHSPWAARRLFFLALYFYLPLLHSSQCLADNNCDMNNFRQGGAELWWTNSSNTWNTENKFYFNSQCASYFITSNKLCPFVSLCVL